MKSDIMTETAKEDLIIVMLGNKWLKNSVDNIMHNKNDTSCHIPLVARLLLKLREISGKPAGTLYDFLVPKNFDLLCEAALNLAVASDDMEALQRPSTGWVWRVPYVKFNLLMIDR